jgi:NAD(P)-dependent dehydrogenase (short-subunit alcohol dehydrogenase family)
LVAYKATKAGMIAFTEQLALHNAAYGIRANCILPGLMADPAHPVRTGLGHPRL